MIRRRYKYSIGRQKEMASKALMIVNVIREGLGLAAVNDLEKGYVISPTCCPIARSLSVELGITGGLHSKAQTPGATSEDRELAEKIRTALAAGHGEDPGDPVCFNGKYEVFLPMEITEFVNAFDDGKLPLYDLELERLSKAEKERKMNDEIVKR